MSASARESSPADDDASSDDGQVVSPVARRRYRFPPRGVAASALLPFPVTLGAFVLIFWSVDIISPALPDLQRSLALSGTSTGLIASAFFGGRLMTNLPAALLVDRIGARRCAMAGGLTLVVGSVLAASAGGIAPLLVARGIQGIGIALVVTASLLSLLRARPGEGVALTAFNVAAGVGSGFGLATGGFLTNQFGWRAIFWLSAMLGAALLIGALTSRPARAKATTISEMPPEPDGPVPARAGWWTMALPLFLNLLVYANYSIFLVSLPLYAAARFSAPAGTIGTLLLLTNLVHLGAAIPLGRGIRRFGASRTVGPSLAIAAVGMFAMLLAPASGWLVVPLSIYAVGQIGGNSSAGDMVLRAGGQGGRAVGMLRLSSDVGLVAGPAAVGVLADLAGTAAPFIALPMLTVLAAAVSWRGGGDQRAGTHRMPAR